MDDVLDVGNVESSGGDIGSDEQGVFPRRESVNILESLALLHRSVERKRRELQHGEEGYQTTYAVDAVAEDDRPTGILLQEVKEVQILLFQSAIKPEGYRVKEMRDELNRP